MSYAIVQDRTVLEYPLDEGDIRLRFPNVSFPIPFSPPADYVRVTMTQPPAADWDEDVVELQPIFENAQWRQQWQVVSAGIEEVQRRTESKAQAVRTERNRRLTASDWTQLPDAASSGVDVVAWSAYRMALRQVPNQPGFPFEVEWPEEPVSTVAPNYVVFWDLLLMSPVYQSIRSRATTDVNLALCCTEFIAAFSDAKAGRPNRAAIQACIFLLLQAAQLDANDLQLLQQAMNATGLSSYYRLTPEP